MKRIMAMMGFLMFVSFAVVMACDQNVRPLPEDGSESSAPASQAQPASTATAETGDAQQEGAATISGTITITPELSARLTGSEVMYIMARPVTGGPPVMVQRFDNLQFPMPYTLTSAEHMAQDPSSAGDVAVVARIDLDGAAGPPQPGDMEGSVSPATFGQTGVDIVVDKAF